LWIDTLCTIQDDKEDWEVEAPKMGEIYSSAYVTLAASAAENCDSGLFKSFRLSLGVGINDSMLAIRASSLHSVEYNSVLDTRAWTLQEDILSRRVLYFGQSQLRWRCTTHSMTEDGVLDDPENIPALAPFPRDILTIIGRGSPIEEWKQLVNE
jgi:hypothetical protein